MWEKEKLLVTRFLLQTRKNQDWFWKELIPLILYIYLELIVYLHYKACLKKAATAGIRMQCSCFL